jgi:hypothetical protein
MEPILKLIILIFISNLCFAFDHQHKTWDQILKGQTKKGTISTLIGYKALKNNPKKLNTYLENLSKVTKSEYQEFTNEQKLSFLINAYNAFTFKLILDSYPIKSIEDIKGEGGFLGFGSSPWKIKFINLLEQKLSLDYIEHKIIRKDFSEPRIHFVVNCASISCPNLRMEAMVADKIEQQLADSAEKFINNKSKNLFDHKKKTITISKIFKWYGDDFKDKYGTYLKFIEKIKKVDNLSEYKLHWMEYNWELNSFK